MTTADIEESSKLTREQLERRVRVLRRCVTVLLNLVHDHVETHLQAQLSFANEREQVAAEGRADGERVVLEALERAGLHAPSVESVCAAIKELCGGGPV